MRKHTTLNIDTDLLRAAQAVLGTSGVTETVQRALQVVIREHWIRWLVDNPVELTSTELEELRRGEALVSGQQAERTRS